VRTAAIASAIFLAAFAIFLQPAVAVQNISLGWNPCLDPDVASYNVHYGLASGQYEFDSPAGTNNLAVVNGLIEGMTYYFVLTVRDWEGFESPPSNEVVYTVPGLAPPGKPWLQSAADGRLILKWDASPSPEVAGYHVYFVAQNNPVPQLLYTGSATEFDLSGLAPAGGGSFLVCAFDSASATNSGSTKVDLTSAPSIAASTPPVLSLAPTPAAGLPNVFSVTAAGAVPETWTLEATADFKRWNAIAAGSNNAVNVTVVVSPKPKLFFRINSPVPGARLQTETPAGALPGSFSFRAPRVTLPAWSIESSENLREWSSLAAGEGTEPHVAVVPTGALALYFRLKRG
jgi:hypothetical protein